MTLPIALLSVVAPVHNEEENIIPLATEVDAALKGRLNYELLFVDDCSWDTTADRLCLAAAANPRVRVVTHSGQSGQSAAIISGVRRAHGEWIVTLDGDQQNDPADIITLVNQLNIPSTPDNTALIIGHRRKRRDTWLKRVSSRIANSIRQRLLHDLTPDSGCGLKLFPRQLFLELPAFDHMHRFLAALIVRHGGGVVSVEVNHRPRVAGRSHYGLNNRLWTGVIDLLGVIWLQHRWSLPDVSEEPTVSERPDQKN